MDNSYTHINEYLLLEYIYGDSSTTYNSNDIKISRILNKYQNQNLQFINNFNNITKNTINENCVKIDKSYWAYLNNNVPTPYLNKDNNIIYTNLSSVLSNLNIQYDIIRLHIVSGYRLEQLDGLIINVYIKCDTNNDDILTLANRVYIKTKMEEIINTKPMMIGEKIFDRYIELYVPSASYIINEYKTNPENPNSIGYQFSIGNKKIDINSLIYIDILEIKNIETVDSNIFFKTETKYGTSVKKESLYSNIYAVVEESTDGDYFLYYGKCDDKYIDEFIMNLNSAGGDNIIINDIDIYEQQSTNFIRTFSFTQIQSSGFDKPLEFRPLLKYADSDVSFSIDYTLRILNQKNGFQIVKKASTTSYNVKKYGKQQERINIIEQKYPIKIYNKILKEKHKALNSVITSPIYLSNMQTDMQNNIQSEIKEVVKNVYVPIYYNKTNIIAQLGSIVEGFDNYKNYYFGQGEAMIYISSFDTYQEFYISTFNTESGTFTKLDIDLNNTFLSFENKNNENILIPPVIDNSSSMNSKGYVKFKINGEYKSEILYDKDPKPFYIISKNDTNTTVIYNGYVWDLKYISSEPERINNIKNSFFEIQNSSNNIINTTTNISADELPVNNINAANESINNIIDASISNNKINKVNKKPKKPKKTPNNKIYIPGVSNDDSLTSVNETFKPIEKNNKI